MYLSKLCLFTLAVTLAASPTVGTLNVQIQEYEVPTPKSRPHDPALAPDGSLWYTDREQTSSAVSIRRLENLRNMR